MNTIRNRLGCLLLAAIMLLSMIPAAFAAPTGMDNFKRERTYAPGTFSDVPEGRWYTEAIQTAYEYGLASGDNGRFDRKSNMSVAMAVTLAARLHAIYNTGSMDCLKQGSPWYQVYVDYALANGIIEEGQFANYHKTDATRAECAAMLSKAIPAEELPAINMVEDGAIPDVAADSPYYEDIYRLYRAGILTGNDTKGTFTPDEPIDRVSMITIAIRMVDTSLRQEVLLTKEYSGSCSAASGRKVTWHFKDGTLTISGTGKMKDYSKTGGGAAPWTNKKETDALYHLKRIVIEEGVTYIGNFAFNNCKMVKEVSMSKSLTQIGRGAFTGCAGLESVVIPDSVTQVMEYAFNNCTGLTSVTLPDGITEISNNVFEGCASLESVVIPEGVTRIRGDAFWGCANLKSIVIPDSVTQIGQGVFVNCTSLTSIAVPDSVTELDGYAFSGCTSLESVVIPDGVPEIGDETFHGCTNLKSVVIPSSVTQIGRSAFSQCTGLESIVIPDSVTQIGSSAFFGCDNLKTIVIPGSVTQIGNNAFENCFNLKSVVISDGVTAIGASAFDSCRNLETIVIPSSVTQIGSNAFWDCGNLTIRYYSSPYMDEYVAKHPKLNFELIE